MSDTMIWFYEFNGSHVGQVTAAVVQQKFREGVIREMTLCWQPAFGTTWRPFRDTALAQGFAPVGQPPPLAQSTPRTASTSNVSAEWAWVIILAPLAATIAQIFLQKYTPNAEQICDIAAFVLTIQGCRADKKQLINAGYVNAPSAWWCLFPPVFLWKRGTLVGNRRHFWAYILFIILSIPISIATNG
jgi:hypothetical protein